jgi:hypothetical protein
MAKLFEFTIKVCGWGDNVEEAWDDVKESFDIEKEELPVENEIIDED